MFYRAPTRRRHRFVFPQATWATLVIVIAAVLLVYGYAATSSGMGLAGKTLWDWLQMFGLFLPTLIVLLMMTTRVSARATRTVRGRAKRVRFVIALGAVAFVTVVIYGYITGAGWVGVDGKTFWDWFEFTYAGLAIALIAWLFAQLVARDQDEGQISPMVMAVAAVGIVGGLFLISYSVGLALHGGSLGFPPALLTAAGGALTAFLSNYVLQQLRDRAQKEREEALELRRIQEGALDKYAEK